MYLNNIYTTTLTKELRNETAATGRIHTVNRGTVNGGKNVDIEPLKKSLLLSTVVIPLFCSWKASSKNNNNGITIFLVVYPSEL